MFNVKKYNYSEKSNPILTVIITFRTNGNYDMIDRLAYRKYKGDYIEFLVVDDGSKLKDSEKARKICQENSFNFIQIDSGEDVFSAGRARNCGAINARTKFIVHEDIDLYPPQGYYENLLNEIKNQHLDDNISDFISIPVYYLTEDASREFLDTEESQRKEYVEEKLLNGESSFFSFCMPASSVIVVNRYHYLSLGGYDETFTKWGLEDLDYAYRLTRSSNKFHTARGYRELVTNPPFAKQTEYKGWRVQFRMFGEACYRKGIFMVHVYHPVDRTWRNSTAHQGNQNKFKKNIELFEKNKYFLPALPAPENGRTLMFGKGCFVYNRKIFPIWGEVILKSFQDFEKVDIVEYIKTEKIDRVVFTNPYAAPIRTKLYNKIKSAGIPFFVVERGALRDSIFVDKTGFCCESSLYSEKYWNHPITEENRKIVKKYILDEQNENLSLEKQSSLIGETKCRDALGINPGEKVIFVAMQSRSDTTTNYFAGKVGSYDNFVSAINELAQKISKKWKIVVKHHPLSKIKEKFISDIIIADDYNIKDLLSIADYVVTMNSGVGVLATVFKKPVIHMSHAFYRSDLLNRYAESADDIIKYINSEFSVSTESCERFISYLINEFYCFGKMKTRNNENYSETSRMTVTTGIDYYSFSINGKRFFKDVRTKPIDYSSPLYDPFRQDITEMVRARKQGQSISSTFANKPTEQQSNKCNNKTTNHKKGQLWEKFKSNPKKYCLDSKHIVLRLIGKIL